MDAKSSTSKNVTMGSANVKVLFGGRVRQLRSLRGWTQEELARKVGLDRSYIGGVERGERNVSIENINLIAKGLCVALTELFAFEEH